MRVFLDANILFSAAKSAGAVRELLARADRAGHVLVADAYVMAEAQRNLETKAPAALPVLAAMTARLEVAPFVPVELPTQWARLLPDKDRPVLAAAVRLGGQALVTGDRTHFGTLYGQTVQGVKVYSPRMLAEALALQGSA